MKPIDPAEISALIDGELPPSRAAEVRRAIAADESLSRVHSELLAMGARLNEAAAETVFEPRVVLPKAAGNLGLRMILAAVALVLARVAMKLSSPVLAAGLAAVLLAVIICGVWWLLTAGPACASRAARGPA